MSRRRERGQAAVELVAVLPVVVALAAAILHALSAGVARELADHAAAAGAAALVQRAGAGQAGAEAAARAAVPAWSRRDMRVEVRGRRVRVRLAAPLALPGLARVLAATASADAGPAS